MGFRCHTFKGRSASIIIRTWDSKSRGPCVDSTVALLSRLAEHVQLRVLFGFRLLQKHVVVMDILESALEADDFLDELEPIV